MSIVVNRFRDNDTERLFNGESVRHLPPDIQRRGRMRLQRVLAATVLNDLRLPPSQRLEALRGDRRG